MKRNGCEGTIDSLSMANCLMLLARGGGVEAKTMITMSDSVGRTFECKTCNRKFPSFQALGGHRASHKKPRLMELGLGLGGDESHQQAQQQMMKPKTHECSICGLEFAIGQALGGHMRRHRAAMTSGGARLLPPPPPPPPASQVAVLKKSQSRRILCLDLDLNLTPFENGIGLDFALGKMSPVPSLIS
ncbi:zinc finger protein ZAT12-like [Telopea speciosissima]|uniref:zinc finger protein ZAT12-like n=1 Tax=Telopea speciosissima TaxID=54955 RepID=UPI001CC79A29|nr:zinc finger protein ZAT12-like [Telopea speciosissima]